MKTLVFTFLVFLSLTEVQAQSRKDLAGTWYGRIRDYQFIQDGTAQCYTKTEVNNYKQKLVIDKHLRYIYSFTRNNQHVEITGKVVLKKDTIAFIESGTSSVEKYFLFHLDKKQLIYSVFPAKDLSHATTADTSGPVFERVETEAVYFDGRDQFLKLLYSSLAGVKGERTDTIHRYLFHIQIDKTGVPDLNSLTSPASPQQYVEAIRRAFPAHFIPAQQNGRPVSARYSFSITY